MRSRFLACKLTMLLLAACSVDSGSSGLGNDGEGDTSTGEDGGSAGTGPGDDAGASSGSSGGPGDDDGPKYDVDPGDGGSDDGGNYHECKVGPNDMDAPACDEKAPADSFDPVVQWDWWGEGKEMYAITTPVVGNFTDDNADGEIDLCDTPDIVIAAYAHACCLALTGHLYMLSGDTGEVILVIDRLISPVIEPAIGDIDNDGLLEIVTGDATGKLLAFEHDGTLAWVGDSYTEETSAFGPYSAVALADLDNDGDLEIVLNELVADHQGKQLFRLPQDQFWSAPVAADLDGDGDLEVIGSAQSAWHHDGTMHFENPDIGIGLPQVADLTGDQDPEILVTQWHGITLTDAHGEIIYADRRPTGDPIVYQNTWKRPAAIHDFDGDGQPEFAMSSENNYAVYEADASILWKAPVSDLTGIAGGTAFDFLGDGTAEAMYGDESRAYVFDGDGKPLMDVPRVSGTLMEYPTVADVDNDGSAEFVVVSSWYNTGDPTATVKVIGDAQNRWVRARRIWNQHTYHVTNVREDGTIPQFEPPHWKRLNTFRTQAQINPGGGNCKPVPEG